MGWLIAYITGKTTYIGGFMEWRECPRCEHKQKIKANKELCIHCDRIVEKEAKEGHLQAFFGDYADEVI